MAATTIGSAAVAENKLPAPSDPNTVAVFTPSPTDPNPPTKGDQAIRQLSEPVLFAKVSSQIAQRQEQPINTFGNKRPAESNNDTQVLNRQLEQSRQAQIESAQNLQNRKPVPGGE